MFFTKPHFYVTFPYIFAVLYCHFAVLHPFLPLLPPKHRLRNRNFSLILCKITLKMHKNKFFCIRHFTLFEQICYKSRKNIKLYLCFLQIILYIYSRFCKIMPYYARLLYPPPLPQPLHAYSHIRAPAHAHAQYIRTHIHTHIRTHNCTCTRTRSIYIWGGWNNPNKKYAPNEQSACISTLRIGDRYGHI